MEKLIECVPNFSEGRLQSNINSIVKSIESINNVTILDINQGKSTNRTVITFVGTPEDVSQAAYLGISKASELIDMRNHKGEHPRIGATDVCPFIPLNGAKMDDCINIARNVGKRVGENLSIPVYLYERAATSSNRKNLSFIRAGEYEGLPEKLKDPYWHPDFGKAEFNPLSGVTTIGARNFLIAFNVNLNTQDKKVASDIASNIREIGRVKRYSNGTIMCDENGKILRKPGLLKSCKALGWYIPEYGKAQVSMNLTNYKITPPHVAFEAVCYEAKKRGINVSGCEIIGLVPLEAMLMAGRYYLTSNYKNDKIRDDDLLYKAIESLGLNDIKTFVPKESILEYKIGL
ncbi:MAG: glutamate formimidoyltransferase [Candidatus Marinimicrobia bacterium]|nr:glutamate formimidoyltransferase [Candidatus Neomarinimicrobiota bacterium]|tara:strand:- start:1320 stop:2360 length:1041 start_codon:yes stop_codon:yes gene_type:complete